MQIKNINSKRKAFSNNTNSIKKTLSLKSVFKGATIYSFGGVFVKCSGFFLLPIYTRVLSPHDYGIIGYLTVLISIATTILGFGFYGAQTRFYYENISGKNHFGKFAFTINIVPLIFSFLFILPLVIVGITNNWKFSDNKIPFYPYVLLAFGTVLMQVLSHNAVSFYRTKQKYIVTTMLQILQFLSITLFSILFIVKFQWGAIGRIAGTTVGLFVILPFIFKNYISTFVWRLSFDGLKYAFSFGLPIVIHLLSNSMHNALDRIILERYISLSDLGIYTLAITIGNTFSIFISSFNQAYQPSYFDLMSSNVNDKDNKIIKIFSAWLFIITLAAVFLLLLGKPFIIIFAGKNFHNTITIFPWIVFGIYSGSFYFFFSSPIFYFKKTSFLPLITGTSAILNLFLNLIFIPFYGVLGAAATTIISHIIQSLLAFIIGNKFYKIKWPIFYILISFIIVSFSFLFVILS